MIILAEHQSSIPASTEDVFARIANSNSHPDWSHDLEWVRLDGVVREGARGRLKPKTGPKSRFVVSEFVPGAVFADTTLLPGAKVTFRHEVSPEGNGARLDVRVSITGVLARLWRRLAFNDAQERVDEDAARLAALLSRETV